MSGRAANEEYGVRLFRREAADFLGVLNACETLEQARLRVWRWIGERQYDASREGATVAGNHAHCVARDCARAMRSIFSERSDSISSFSVAQAMWDLAAGRDRPDLAPDFFAEMIHLFRGVRGIEEYPVPVVSVFTDRMTGRDAAVARSGELDELGAGVEKAMARFADGLSGEAIARRAARRKRVLSALEGTEADWNDWEWHARNVITDASVLRRAVKLSGTEEQCVSAAARAGLPFGVTPYYASLMDDDPEERRDTAIRAQVLPPPDYVAFMAENREERRTACDFMLERDTSPVDLVTRRYPAIAILKPFNTCPQICVYCQRNWEIARAMDPAAAAPWEKIEEACRWLEARPAIREVLVTGGDPLALPDEALGRILERLARIDSLDYIRIGSRTLATMPMRVTGRLAAMLGGLRIPGRRELGLVTHVEHPYEITPELVTAANRLRREGIAVYNQLVYTFYVSRRFEAARLRMLLRRCGIDPYYTFATKGKEETAAYRVPIARLLQEQKEEARLLPGTRRTDEPVFNLPGLGKNYLRAVQHRDMISVLPDGSRVYEFHPWEKNIVQRDRYVGADVPILHYLRRLAEWGEDIGEYSTIWHYF